MYSTALYKSNTSLFNMKKKSENFINSQFITPEIFYS
jgi:hypothetical protein